MTFTYIMGTSFEYFQMIFLQSLLRYHTIFPPLRAKLSTAVSELFVLAVSTRPRPPNGVLGVHPSGGPRNESRQVLNRDGSRGRWRKKFKVHTSAGEVNTGVL
jgi:hypothetical protein